MENQSLNNDLSINSPQPEDSQTPEKKVVQSYDIPLLEEKLVVQRRRKMVGEIVVRKEIETRMVHIPIRREKLIVEKVGVTAEHLTEINLAGEKVNGVKYDELGNANDIYQSQSKFISLERLQKLLTDIANSPTNDNIKFRLEIISDRPELQESYQDICDQF